MGSNRKRLADQMSGDGGEERTDVKKSKSGRKKKDKKRGSKQKDGKAGSGKPSKGNKGRGKRGGQQMQNESRVLCIFASSTESVLRCALKVFSVIERAGGGSAFDRLTQDCACD